VFGTAGPVLPYLADMSVAGTITWSSLGASFAGTSKRGPQVGNVPAGAGPFATGRTSGQKQAPAGWNSGLRETDARNQSRERHPSLGVNSPGVRVSGRLAEERSEGRRLEPDWNVLVGRCLGGDSVAWTELVRAHHRRVYSLCYRFTGSPQDSEDLTQDVFLKIYGNLGSFDSSRGSFQVWIATLTRNLLVDHFRRSRQQRATDSIDAGWDDPEDGRPADRLTDSRPTPHENAATQELQKMVQEALTRISPELREAVILRDLQDLDYKEIAQVLQIPEGTVKSRISRGRAELARLLERNKKQVV
jgi:RNA polymerase sigma-70 factor, ECF subfamily